MPRFHLIIGSAGSRVDDTLEKSRIHDFSRGFYFHRNTETELWGCGIEGTKIIGENFRKHRNNPIRKIGAISSSERFAVEERSFPYIFCDIGDMDRKLKITVCEFAHTNRIVEIFGIVAVDRDDDFVSRIFAIARGVGVF